MGIAKFQRLTREAQYDITWRKFYLIGPNHIRFGLKPVDASVIGRIPLLRELLVSGVVYVLSLNHKD